MEREDIAKNLGNNIKKFRLEKGFSQENLALRAGIHPAYLGRLERGEKCPTLDTVFKICDALSVPVADIITFSEKENKSEGDKKTVEEILEKLPKSKQDKQTTTTKKHGGLCVRIIYIRIKYIHCLCVNGPCPCR